MCGYQYLPVGEPEAKGNTAGDQRPRKRSETNQMRANLAVREAGEPRPSALPEPRLQARNRHPGKLPDSLHAKRLLYLVAQLAPQILPNRPGIIVHT